MNDLRIKRATIESRLQHTEEHVQKETEAMLMYITLLERPGEFYAAEYGAWSRRRACN